MTTIPFDDRRCQPTPRNTSIGSAGGRASAQHRTRRYQVRVPQCLLCHPTQQTPSRALRRTVGPKRCLSTASVNLAEHCTVYEALVVWIVDIIGQASRKKNPQQMGLSVP